MDKMRQSGILMHISSLPGKFGTGDFGEGAYRFADFLKRTGTLNWQILPLGITGYGDSPYQSFSAFAGNPYFIDLQELINLGYLSEEEVEKADIEGDGRKVDFGALYERKMPLLRTAFHNARNDLKGEMKEFYMKEKWWLRDFAIFMALKNHHGGKSFKEWEEKYKLRDKEALYSFVSANRTETEFWIFTQYFFFRQWFRLKEYVNKLGIKIIGDIPIYVSEDGSDIWSAPEMFRLDEDLDMITKAGCPPDAFTDEGQLWGNPIYDWDAMKEDGYSWWIKRIRESFRLYDVVRIDHFRGFESFWEIEGHSDTAKSGWWSEGPGMDLFGEVKERLGEPEIMAEDLGFLTPEVTELIESTGFPGMKVLVFAFDSRENSDYLPHNYIKNSVVYTSNHDTQTVCGYMESAPEDERNFAVEYLLLSSSEGYGRGFMRGAWASVSYLAVAPMQDLLNLGDKARFNIPSTLGGNWHWRMNAGDITSDAEDFLKKLNRTYRRNNA